MSTILREALEPFAKAAALYEFDPKKGDRDWGQYEDDTLVGLGDITVGDLRRARAALSSEGQEREGPHNLIAAAVCGLDVIRRKFKGEDELDELHGFIQEIAAAALAAPSLPSVVGKEQGQAEASRYVVPPGWVLVPLKANYGLIESLHDTRDWEAEDYSNALLNYAMQVGRVASALSAQHSGQPAGSLSFPEEASVEADGGHPNPAPPQERGGSTCLLSVRDKTSSVSENKEHETQSQESGEGYVLVPKEPTELMLQGAGHHFIASRDTVKKMWAWMLSRAPSPSRIKESGGCLPSPSAHQESSISVTPNTHAGEKKNV